ncbi:group 1 glycosyl transferase, partial [bacterium]|nr:group 1 glycosyl transferase [bacterium]
MNARVVIIQKSLPQYRRAFFEKLKTSLEKRKIELVLVYGHPEKKEASKNDLVEISWAHKIKNRIIKFAGKAFYWQPCLPVLKNTDLIIVEQANKLLINYYLWILNLLGIIKLAFWGHGKNFQATAQDNLSEALKRFISRKVHWWFAYNKLAAETIKTLGFQESRITVVQNAIDTRFLVKKRSEVSAKELRAFRDRTGITSSNVAVFSGGMYAKKRIGFLLQACRLIKQEVPDFEMIFLGAGPDELLVREAAQHQKWIHYE